VYNFHLAFQIEFYRVQGTKVLEDRVIRHHFGLTTEGSPPQTACPGITKYTGTLISPEWEDIEPGRAFTFPYYLVKRTQSKKKPSSKRCAVSEPTSPALRTQPTAIRWEELVTDGNMT